MLDLQLRMVFGEGFVQMQQQSSGSIMTDTAQIQFVKKQKQASDVTPDAGKQISWVALQTWWDIPLWQQKDNHFIETGYRY
jgi:hypothetical protein